MPNSLSRVCTILNCQMDISPVYCLEPLRDLLGSHEEIQHLDLRQILDFGDDPPAADENVPLGIRLEIDSGEYVLPEYEYLVGREGNRPEHDLVCYFLHPMYY